MNETTGFEKALRLACDKGGYLGEIWIPGSQIIVWSDRVTIKNKLGESYVGEAGTLLDGEFWQALGKTLGWPLGLGKWIDNEFVSDGWKFYAHRYLDIKLTGGDEDKFFEDLLK